MNRRDYLRGAVVGGVLSLAGCAGVTARIPGFGEGGSADHRSSGDAGSGADDPAREYRELDRQAAKRKLKIIEHSLGTDRAGLPRVKGVVENVGNGNAAYVEIVATFYDADGDRIDRGVDRPINIGPGETYTFRVYPDDLIDVEPIDDYELAFGAVDYYVPR